MGLWIERMVVPYVCINRYEVEATFCDGVAWFSHSGHIIEWDDRKLGYDFGPYQEEMPEEEQLP